MIFYLTIWIFTTACYGLLPINYVKEMREKCPHLAPESYTPACPFANFKDLNSNVSNFPCNKVPLTFFFAPNKLILFNDRTQSIAVTGFVQFRWLIICSNLSATPNGGYFYSQPEKWWLPNIAHANSDSDYEMKNSMKRLFLVPQDEEKTGFNMKFSMQYLGLFSSHCNLALEAFPFDSQNCSIDFIVQEVDKVYNITVYNSIVELRYSDFASHSSVWMLINHGTSCSIVLSSGRNRWICKVWFVLKRKPAYYIINLMIPSALLSLLEIFAFYLEKGEPDRPAFGLTILLTFAFLRTEIMDTIPETSDYSFLGKYNDLCSVFALCCTIYFLVMSWFQRKKIQCFLGSKLFKPNVLDNFAMALAIITLTAINVYAIVSAYLFF